MNSEEKSLRVIEFSGKKQDWKFWSRKFLARANQHGYKKLIEGMVKVPTQTAYETACRKDETTPSHKKTIANYNLSVRAFKDLILSINGETKAGRVAFKLVN